MGNPIPKGAGFSAPIHIVPGANPDSYGMCRGSFPWVEWLGSGVYQPTPYSVKVKEREELYISSTCGPWWPVIGETYFFNISY
jgi:hypothetical protein